MGREKRLDTNGFDISKNVSLVIGTSLGSERKRDHFPITPKTVQVQVTSDRQKAQPVTRELGDAAGDFIVADARSREDHALMRARRTAHVCEPNRDQRRVGVEFTWSRLSKYLRAAKLPFSSLPIWVAVNWPLSGVCAWLLFH